MKKSIETLQKNSKVNTFKRANQDLKNWANNARKILSKKEISMALFGNRNTLRDARKEQRFSNNIDAMCTEIKHLRQENKKLREKIKELEHQLKIWNDPTYPNSGW